MSDCIGTKCHQIDFNTSDLTAETWQVDGSLSPQGEQYVYPYPPVGGSATAHTRAAFAHFETEGAAEMATWVTRPGSCTGDCTCALSKDKKDIISVTTQVGFHATWPFPDGSGTITIHGHYKLETIRTEGICTVGRALKKTAQKPQKKLQERLDKLAGTRIQQQSKKA